MTPFARDHGAAVEVALLVFLRHRRGGEKEDAHHFLAAERPLDQGVHGEDDRDDGEEDSVDVHVWQIGRRVIDPLLALPFPGVISLSCCWAEGIVLGRERRDFIPPHLFGESVSRDGDELVTRQTLRRDRRRAPVLTKWAKKVTTASGT